MSRRPLFIVVMVLCGAIAALYLGRLLFAALSPFDHALLLAAGWTKCFALLVAAVFAFRSAALLGAGNPARLPWLLLAYGLTAMTLGQATLDYYQAFLGTSPFPSVADVWFVIAYPLFIAGVIAFIAAYARSGFPMAGTAVLFVLLSAGALAASWPLLAPVIRSADAPLTKALNLLYPALDLVLLVPAIVLLRITSRFRGGAVWHIWLALLAGFVFTAIGDILFAYFSTLGLTQLDPAVHAMYLVAYGGLAAGAMVQRQLLAA